MKDVNSVKMECKAPLFMRSFATTSLVFISLYKMLYNSEKVRDALPYKTTYLLRHYLSKWNAFLVLMASFHEFMKHSHSRESNVNLEADLLVAPSLSV